MANVELEFGVDGTLSTTAGLLLTVPANATVNWAFVNTTDKALMVSFNRSSGDVTASYNRTSFHGDTDTAVDLVVSADEFIHVPVGGHLRGSAVNSDAANAETFGIRDIVTAHGTGRMVNQSAWLFVD